MFHVIFIFIATIYLHFENKLTHIVPIRKPEMHNENAQWIATLPQGPGKFSSWWPLRSIILMFGLYHTFCPIQHYQFYTKISIRTSNRYRCHLSSELLCAHAKKYKKVNLNRSQFIPISHIPQSDNIFLKDGVRLSRWKGHSLSDLQDPWN